MGKGVNEAGYDRQARRRPVNLSLNNDLLAQAKRFTSNVSATVEELLADFVRTQQARERSEDEKLERVIDALGELHRRDGLLSDEFPSL